MLTKTTALQLLRDNLPYLRAEYGVERIGLFGSLAADAPTETSDVDLVVEFQRPIGLRFLELVEYLENAFGRDVDVLTPAGIRAIRVARIARNITDSVIYV